MEQELAYSFHLGSDKNKSKLAKKVSKGNVSGRGCWKSSLVGLEKNSELENNFFNSLFFMY